jgi:putative transposase
VKAYKYKLQPSAKFIAIFESWLGICCELYNAALQERRDAWRQAKKSIKYQEQQNTLPEIKETRRDVSRVHSQVLQNVLRRVESAFDGFFGRIKKGKKKAGYPRFRSRHRYASFTYPQSDGFEILGGRLHLSKIGSVKIHLSRPIVGTMKTCQIKREADGWYAIIVVEAMPHDALAMTNKTAGIDVGLENFATLSNGEKIANPKYLRASERKLKTSQRAVSRKKRSGKNRQKSRQLLAKKHLKIKRQRLDFHHKEAQKLVATFDTLVVEDLNIAGMMKNHHLAKSISDAGWNQFILILTSKAENAGRKVIVVDPAFTSQDCSQCRNRVRKGLAEREHRCIACGFVAHRDHNSAINIENKAGSPPSGMGAVALPCELKIYQPAELESPSISCLTIGG